jgi:hypothetical protein
MLVEETEYDAFVGSIQFFSTPWAVRNGQGEDRLLSLTFDSVWRSGLEVRPQSEEPIENRNTSSKTSSVSGDSFTLAVANRTSQGRSSQVRPDLVMIFRGTESFVGEAKKPELEGGIELALEELSSKLAPNPQLSGDAPFIPAFAIQVPHVQFALLVPNPQDAFATSKTVRVGKLFDVTLPTDRVRLVSSMALFYELWHLLVDLWPKQRIQYGESIVRTKQVTMYRGFVDDFPVQKVLAVKLLLGQDLQSICWPDLMDLYQVAPTIPYLARAYSPSAPLKGAFSHTLKLYPVGYSRSPTSREELVEMAKCVLTSLIGMHKAGFVHRDVREPNVVRLCDANWWLIDLERARKDISCPWPDDMKPEFLPKVIPAAVGKDLCWRPVHDVWQLARCVNELEETLQDGHRSLGEAIWRCCWPKGQVPQGFNLKVGPDGKIEGGWEVTERALNLLN